MLSYMVNNTSPEWSSSQFSASSLHAHYSQLIWSFIRTWHLSASGLQRDDIYFLGFLSLSPINYPLLVLQNPKAFLKKASTLKPTPAISKSFCQCWTKLHCSERSNWLDFSCYSDMCILLWLTWCRCLFVYYLVCQETPFVLQFKASSLIFFLCVCISNMATHELAHVD